MFLGAGVLYMDGIGIASQFNIMDFLLPLRILVIIFVGKVC